MRLERESIFPGFAQFASLEIDHVREAPCFSPSHHVTSFDTLGQSYADFEAGT